MGQMLAAHTSNRNNNFNLIRFIAASLVLYSHSFALVLGGARYEPLYNTIGFSWGSIAVDVFFVTSGFLITASYFARNDLAFFSWARILRIYPALIVCSLICVFIVGLSFTELTTAAYLTDFGTYKYLIRNSLLISGIEFNLPGVFLDLPYKGLINASLWTLPYEVLMYTLLAIALLMISFCQTRKILPFSTKQLMLAMAVSAVIINIANHHYQFAPNKPVHLFSMFFVGASFFLWKEHIFLTSKLFAVLLIAVLASATINKDIFFVIYVLSIPYLTFFLAYMPSGKVKEFNKFGDYSYGIYIYAFPVQQSIVALMPQASVTTMILLSSLVTFFLAFLSWHLIEKRFLKMKSSYVVFEKFLMYLRLAPKAKG